MSNSPGQANSVTRGQTAASGRRWSTRRVQAGRKPGVMAGTREPIRATRDTARSRWTVGGDVTKSRPRSRQANRAGESLDVLNQHGRAFSFAADDLSERGPHSEARTSRQPVRHIRCHPGVSYRC